MPSPRPGYLHSRDRDLLRDYLFSFLSKAATLLVVLIALPLTSRALGPDGVSRLGVAANLLVWASILNPALGPEMTVALASDTTSGLARRYRFHSLVLGLGTSIVMIGSTWGVLLAVSQNHHSVLLAACAVTVLLTTVAGIAEAVRLSEHRAARTSVWVALSTAVGVSLTTVLTALGVNEPWPLFVTLYSLPVALRALSIVDSRTPLFEKQEVSRFTPRLAWRIASRNALHMITQLTVFAGYPLATLLFSVAGRSFAGGRLFILQILATTAVGLVQSALQPVAARVSSAIASGDSAWVRSLVGRFSVANASIAVFATALLSTIGPGLAELLYGDLAPTRAELAIVGLSIGAVNLSSFLYQIILGEGHPRDAALALVPGLVCGALLQGLAAIYGNVLLVVLSAGVVQPLVFWPFLWAKVKSK